MTEPDGEVLDKYNRKCRWASSSDGHGPLTRVEAATAICWRSGGWAGRNGFETVGRWSLA